MKRILICFLLLLLICQPLPVSATDTEKSFDFELSVDGAQKKQASPGDIITVMFKLKRTDDNAPYIMYGMQNEIQYDTAFFEYVEGSEMAASQIETRVVPRQAGMTRVYMNFVSFSGGTEWKANTSVGSFQLKVIGTNGSSVISCENYLVSLKDGSGSYPSTGNKVVVSVTANCMIQFDSRGGSYVEPISAKFGTKIKQPAMPEKEGKYFAGWYSDILLKNAWNFDEDVVEGNMTLYAKWSDTPIEMPSGNENGPSLLPLISAMAVVLIVIVVLIFVKKKEKK